ncbi:MAG: N-acetylmuramoyl-L-alanine amidase [Candidatus Eremiobacteraeota bacterium]|nr:N-acetylmuramoyl-L-alanine amidase [Candidatus Eremiobacteraeota bacterium]MCW5866670.1 N-acetylmuramoyl-L-alanine amidase [Candidatus Eremiobacteraeota bacterium]
MALRLWLLLGWLAGCAWAQPAPFVSRAAWGSEPLEMPAELRHSPRLIVLHHSGVFWQEGDDAFQKIRALQRWGQKEKHWPDLPYHFLIDPKGQIFEGRELQYRPESNTEYNLEGVINVELWGNFEEQPVTPAALESTANLLAWLRERHGLGQISTHRSQAPGQTQCPGQDFFRYFESGELQKMVDSR